MKLIDTDQSIEDKVVSVSGYKEAATTINYPFASSVGRSAIQLVAVGPKDPSSRETRVILERPPILAFSL